MALDGIKWDNTIHDEMEKMIHGTRRHPIAILLPNTESLLVSKFMNTMCTQVTLIEIQSGIC